MFRFYKACKTRYSIGLKSLFCPSSGKDITYVNTNGKTFGYDQGIRFIANEEAIVEFISSLENDIKLLLGDYDISN